MTQKWPQRPRQTLSERNEEVAKVTRDALMYGTGVSFMHADGSVHHMALDRISVDGEHSPFIDLSKCGWNNLKETSE